MQIIESVGELLTFVENAAQKGLKTGLVPTMGALHKGHLSLVKRSKEENDVTIVSIFVNPVQFNNPKDLATYPRQPEEDFKLLAQSGADIVFAPQEKEIYPPEFNKNKTFNLGNKADVMEGQYRPGHFQGVALVVERLFRLCRPTRAYFGQKDFQQIVVISQMTKSEHIDVQIIPCPIVREESGLAYSSRNALLSPQRQKEAALIYRTLKESKELMDENSVRETKLNVIDEINSHEGFRVEYFEIVDGNTLLPVESWTEADYIVGCITVYVDDVRLIDNIEYRKYDN